MTQHFADSAVTIPRKPKRKRRAEIATPPEQSDWIWGGEAIAAEIGCTPEQLYYLASRGAFGDAVFKLVARQWSRRARDCVNCRHCFPPKRLEDFLLSGPAPSRQGQAPHRLAMENYMQQRLSHTVKHAPAQPFQHACGPYPTGPPRGAAVRLFVS